VSLNLKVWRSNPDHVHLAQEADDPRRVLVPHLGANQKTGRRCRLPCTQRGDIEGDLKIDETARRLSIAARYEQLPALDRSEG
jgi:hypothetical protein